MSGATEFAQSAPQMDHAAQMDGVYALQRHIYDLTRKYYLFGRDTLIRELRPKPGHHVLEVGCGTARNIANAAQRYPGARFYGIDISSQMLKTAEAKVASLTGAKRITLGQADATQFDPHPLFRRREFDRIFFSYTLSMIPDWQASLRMAAQLLAPGGEIHIVDFGQQERLPRWFRSILHQWLDRFHVTPRSDLFDFTRDLSEEYGFHFSGRELMKDYARIAVIRRS